ncbi:murein hydrolase activator EnvC [Chromobacterium sp. IIBBL 290-4]|uniref:murein hydrolase activator EnvC family protein n=1 Tax=Chromobacterium sp. IIBBL 290-4 TaxID=2953890 RepID=UPI0020B8656C|nr:peptidoglycan DD-metalloendopeptidase family protein [Chromobacterium sp. IIBBL 290-4]UTH72765.1 peptidoglycan DD-metalloendopeptidase family protein [Chromobacterium sp. IIBBL 290-4]
MKRYLLLALIAGAAQAANTDSSTLSVAPHQQDLKNVRKEIDSLKKDLAQKQTVQKEAQSAIKESEQAITQTRQALATLEQKQNRSEQQLADLRAQIEKSRKSLAEVRGRVGQMLVRQYKNGQHDAMKLMLNASDPNQSARDLTYYQHIARAEQQLVQQLIDQQKKLETLSAQLEQELAQLNSLSNRKSQEKTELEQDKTQQVQQLNKVAGEIKQGQSKLTQLQEDEKRLGNLIAQINREIQRRKAEAARKAAEARKAKLAAAREAARKENERRRKLAEQAKKQGKPVPEEAKKQVVVKEEPAQKVDDVADDSAAGRAFASLQGKLKMPVAGQIAGSFGKMRREGTTWKGIFIRTANGQAVHSVADGTVVYADELRGFGKAVIIDHGGNYMTVYTGLSVIGKSSGSSVKAGETLGNTGALDNGDAGLYFEIRHLGRPLNPQAWAR